MSYLSEHAEHCRLMASGYSAQARAYVHYLRIWLGDTYSPITAREEAWRAATWIVLYRKLAREWRAMARRSREEASREAA